MLNYSGKYEVISRQARFCQFLLWDSWIIPRYLWMRCCRMWHWKGCCLLLIQYFLLHPMSRIKVWSSMLNARCRPEFSRCSQMQSRLGSYLDIKKLNLSFMPGLSWSPMPMCAIWWVSSLYLMRLRSVGEMINWRYSSLLLVLNEWKPHLH